MRYGKTHGLSLRAEYAAWAHMKDRCYNPKAQRYKNYGGRGITVCDRWLESFENFYFDIGARPSPKHSLERRDNDGNYEPGNCYWATPKEQAQNRRTSRLWLVDGVTYPSAQSAANALGIPRSTFYARYTKV